jgi:hypothetical protein
VKDHARRPIQRDIWEGALKSAKKVEQTLRFRESGAMASACVSVTALGRSALGLDTLYRPSDRCSTKSLSLLMVAISL